MFRVTTTFLICIFFIGGCNVRKDNPSQYLTSKYFVDVTDQVKLNFVDKPGVDGSYFMPEIMGSGCAFLDYDNDGKLDIYLINSTRLNKKEGNNLLLRNRLFHQEPNGEFKDVTLSSGLGDLGYGMGVAVGDIDNDGYVDVYISNYGLDALYHNNGNGTFTDISRSAGISNPEWGCSVVFFDYNIDNYLDIYVANYVDYDSTAVCSDKSGRPDYCGPEGFSGVSDVLYRNNGDGTFTDVSKETRISSVRSKGLGVVSADFDNDFFPDLYVANDGEPNQLWINKQDGTFENQAFLLGAAVNELGHSEAGMGVGLGDFDNDSNFDLFVTHLGTESSTLYRNTGEYGFHDETSLVGLVGPTFPYTGFGTGFFDFDLDGDLDIAVVNGRVTRGLLLISDNSHGYWDDYAEPNFLFENNGLGRFQTINKELSGLDAIENSRGIAFGDVDNDGDIDLLITNRGGAAKLYRNEVGTKGHWIIIRAIDPKIQRDAIGAKITVLAGGKRMYRIVAPNSGYLSSNDPRVHFGLDSANEIDEIIVQWPDGSKQTISGVKTNQIIAIRKGQSELISK